MKESIKKSPKSAMALYVKMYCQKQDKRRNRQYTLIEATKSWFSLSKDDKQYFINIFNEYKAKAKIHFASSLQNVQLYMKKKHNSRSISKSKEVTVNRNQSTNEDTEIIQENSCSVWKDEHNAMEIQHQPDQLENHDPSISVENEMHNNTQPDVPRLIREPIPPMRSSMELFEIIKHNNELTQNVTWADLTKLQKQRYQRALHKIKHDYIKQYTEYLEQLTPEELFLYYKSKS